MSNKTLWFLIAKHYSIWKFLSQQLKEDLCLTMWITAKQASVGGSLKDGWSPH